MEGMNYNISDASVCISQREIDNIYYNYLDCS